MKDLSNAIQYVEIFARYLRSFIFGEPDVLESYADDFSDKAVTEHLLNYEDTFAGIRYQDSGDVDLALPFYKDFILNPTYRSLIVLSERERYLRDIDCGYIEDDSMKQTWIDTYDFSGLFEPGREGNPYTPYQAYKMGFLCATTKYLCNASLYELQNEVSKVENKSVNAPDTIRLFARNIFAPYASYILDAMDNIIMNPNDPYDQLEGLLFYSDR